MSLGLVAYDSSDEDSENSEVYEQNVIAENQQQNQDQVGVVGPAAVFGAEEEQNGASADNDSDSGGGSRSRRTDVRGVGTVTPKAVNNGDVRCPNVDDDGPAADSSRPARNVPDGDYFLTGHISDEEEDVSPGPAKFSILAGLPAPKNTSAEENVDLSFFSRVPKKVHMQAPPAESTSSLLSGLPAPKPQNTSKVTLPGYEGEDEVEEEYKKKPVKAEIPVPKKKKQPVKITVPALPELDSDEEDEPRKKKPKPTGGGLSGLLSVLPAPKQMGVKEKGRALIPHTLTKRPAPKSVPTKPIVRPPSKANMIPGIPDNVDSDSDEEGESVNFFSLGGDTSTSSVSNTKNISADVLTPPSIFPEVKNRPVSVSGTTVDSSSKTNSMASFLSEMAAEKTSTVSSYKDSTKSYDLAGLRGPYSSGSVPDSNYDAAVGQSYGYSEELGANSGAAVGYSGEVAEQSYESGLYQPSVQQMEQMTNDEQFQRMVGRKFRGESMHIVDVNAEDQMQTQVELTKHLSEEKSGFSYSKKKNKDMPSSTQKRKHQITYLAYQAKERELELKNQWAHNRQNKRQAQSKYGF